MLKTKLPVSLRNTPDLQLGPIYLKHLGYADVPVLLTIYELEKPAILAYNEIKMILEELGHNKLSDYAIKGLFSLAIAHFEIMLSDTIKKQLQFFPDKIGGYKSKVLDNEETKKNIKEISFTKESIYRGGLVNSIILNEILKLSYRDITNQIEAFRHVLSLTLESVNVHLDQLIEIKETRNLLLHNNLLINDFYLNKTKGLKRSQTRGERIVIDKPYAIASLELILNIVNNIIVELRSKFGSFTLLSMLQRVWRYTFENNAIRMQDFANLNTKEDIFDGPFTFPDFLSSSEKTYMEFWQAQRTDKPMSSLSLVHLSSGSKLSFLVDVFGELRLTHW